MAAFDLALIRRAHGRICRRPAVLGALALSAMLSACSPGAQSRIVGAPPGAPQQGARGAVAFRIVVPRAAAATGRRRAAYVSPATAQLAIDVQTGCPGACVSAPSFPQTVALTPTAAGCSSTLASTLCELSIPLAPGAYTAALTAEDAGGTALSTAQSIAFSVTGGADNVVSVTLAGIPTSIVVALTNPVSHALVVEALDADGNIIAGPGSPTFAVAQTGGIGLTLGQPTSAAPNTFTAVPASTGSATVSITASYGSGVTNACLQPGAACSASVTLTSSLPPLFIATQSGNRISEYLPPYTGSPIATIERDLDAPWGLAFDGTGNMYVANYLSNDVTVYAPPYTGNPIRTISGSMNEPFALAFSPTGNLLVSNIGNDETGNVTQYAAPYTGGSIGTTPGLSGPQGLAFDPSGNLWVGDAQTGKIVEYAPPYTGAPLNSTFYDYGYIDLTFSPSGNLFVSDGIDEFITEFATPFTGATVTTLSNVNGAGAIAFDPLGDLFEANGFGDDVKEYAPPYTGSAIATISSVPGDGGLAFQSGSYVLAVSQ